jgi:hypothetical protein
MPEERHRPILSISNPSRFFVRLRNVFSRATDGDRESRAAIFDDGHVRVAGAMWRVATGK